KTWIADLVPLHSVARGLERLGRGYVLTDLSVSDAAEMQKVRDLAGVRRRVDQGQCLSDAVEGHLAIPRVHLRLRQEAQQRRALALLGFVGQGLGHLVADDCPVASFSGGLGGQAVENKTFRRGERLVAKEIVEALAEPGREDLERPN